jgi:hypothetical protein
MKKVVVYSLVGIAIVTTSYFVLNATNNGAAFALTGVLGFAACPAMCAVMGGAMWIARQFGNRKNQRVNSGKENTELQSCHAKHERRNEDLENPF